MSTILVFDSGVGGLSVLGELRKAVPGARIVYVADNAGFPYGGWPGEALSQRVVRLFDGLIGAYEPDIAVIACNTASTLVLPPLRARFATPFVGTVPAIKPAAENTRSGLVSVLGTQGTVSRDYTRELVSQFASGCSVTLVAATGLAAIAEDKLLGRSVDQEALAREIAPAFVERDGRRSDQVVLACTHYPLLLEELRKAAPWPVEWIDPAAAIARRTAAVLAGHGRVRDAAGQASLALFSDAGKVNGALKQVLSADYALGVVLPFPDLSGTCSTY